MYMHQFVKIVNVNWYIVNKPPLATLSLTSLQSYTRADYMSTCLAW
jgi:hypothetical protein